MTTSQTPVVKLLSDLRYAVLPLIEWPLDRFSLVGAGTFFDPSLFPWAADVEREWRSIRAELDQVLKRPQDVPGFEEILPSQGGLTQDKRWKTFMLYGYGHKMEENCARCPETTRLIEQIPGMTTAFFSILEPGKHIPEHRGFYKGVLRYHLGLMVPQPAEQCRIRVGQDVRWWEEGKSLIFDDSHMHEVWNDTDGMRVVLFLDVIRPLPEPLAALNRGLIELISRSPFVAEARERQKVWAQKQRVGTVRDGA